MLPLCGEKQIVFIPFFSLQTGLTAVEDKLAGLAREKGLTAAQMNLAWLLHRLLLILPIPGTTPVGHLKENIRAKEISLSEKDMAFPV